MPMVNSIFILWSISIVQAEYWHDPHNEESYKLDCLFLPDINQEIVSYKLTIYSCYDMYIDI